MFTFPLSPSISSLTSQFQTNPPLGPRQPPFMSLNVLATTASNSENALQPHEITDLVGRMRANFLSWTGFLNMPPPPVRLPLPGTISVAEVPYQGTQWNGEPDTGFGTWIYPNGQKAHGHWKNRAFIEGTIIGFNSYLRFVQGKISEGAGTWCFYQRDTYTGTWQNGYFIRGKVLFKDIHGGELFIEGGRPKSGYGRWLNHEGMTMLGRWTEFNFDGLITSHRGTRWVGTVVNNQPWNGAGIWVDLQGNKQGQWREGVWTPGQHPFEAPVA